VNGTCEICLREDLKLTKHHLIPKATHKRKRVQKQHDKEELHGRLLWICRGCHNHVHATLSERELADEYNTIETLLAHPEIEKYIEWIRGRKVTGKVRSARSARRKRR